MVVHDSPARERVVTPEFALMLGAAVCFFFAFGMTLPVLPYLVASLGGGDLAIGVVVGVVAVSATLIRPLIPPRIRSWGFQRLILAGAVCGAVSFAGYGIAGSLVVLVLLRLVTGASQAVLLVSSYTRIMSVTPPARRSQAVSWFSIAPYLGLGIGPVAGHPIYVQQGFTAVFVAATVIALVGSLPLILVRNVRLPLAPGETAGPRFNASAVWPGTVLSLGIVGAVALSAFTPLYVTQLGGGNPAWIYLAYSGVVLSGRMFGGGIPDRIGAIRAGTLATVAVIAGLVLIAAAPSVGWIYVGVVPFGIGMALQYPGLLALTVNRVAEHERAAAVATFTMFFDLATGVGGLLVGQAAAVGGYRAAFGACAVCSLAGLAVLRILVPRGGTGHHVPETVAVSS